MLVPLSDVVVTQSTLLLLAKHHPASALVAFSAQRTISRMVVQAQSLVTNSISTELASLLAQGRNRLGKICAKAIAVNAGLSLLGAGILVANTPLIESMWLRGAVRIHQSLLILMLVTAGALGLRQMLITMLVGVNRHHRLGLSCIALAFVQVFVFQVALGRSIVLAQSALLATEVVFLALAAVSLKRIYHTLQYT